MSPGPTPRRPRVFPSAKAAAISFAIGVISLVAAGYFFGPWIGGMGALVVLSMVGGWSALQRDSTYYYDLPPGEEGYPTDHYGGD